MGLHNERILYRSISKISMAKDSTYFPKSLVVSWKSLIFAPNHWHNGLSGVRQ